MTSSPSPWELPDKFPIRDHNGLLVAYHARVDLPDGGKTMPWYRSDGVTMGLAGRSTSSMPLFGSEEVTLHPVGQPFIVCEGEKAMWGLSQLGQWPVLGTVTGAGNPGHTVDALSPVAKDRIFILWPDNDEPGRAHMDTLAQNLLQAGARKVSIINVPSDWPKGADAWDFIQPGTWPEFGEREQWLTRVIEDVRSLVKERSRPVKIKTLIFVKAARSTDKDFLTALDFVDRTHAKRSGKQWKAVCPAHPDKVASLSIREGENGKAIVHCHAGCSFRDILTALGVK